MKIKEFDRIKGIYEFELTEFETEFHAHPAIEIVLSMNGGIQIETTKGQFENIYFAVIDANFIHKMSTPKQNNNVLMIECNSDFLKKNLLQFGINFNEGIYIEESQKNRNLLMDKFRSLYQNGNILKTTNLRVHECLNYLDSSMSEYNSMLKTLATRTKLSESRISHIFKEEMGVSIKKYMVWSRLKKAFEIVLSGEGNMYEAAFQSGFYDQAHLSKAFKQMLGINPSKVFNSRILQE